MPVLVNNALQKTGCADMAVQYSRLANTKRSPKRRTLRLGNPGYVVFL